MFYKGTKVIGKTNLRNHIHNEEGVVIREPSQHDDNVGVQFKNKIRFGHDGNGLGRDGHCYFCHQSSLKIISGSNISISDITTEFEHKQFKRRSFNSLARGIKCTIKDVKLVIEANRDIFFVEGKMCERVVTLE